MDTISKEARSKNMSAIRSKKTSLEEAITSGLWKAGIRFRKNVPKLFGRPDIAIKKYKIVIFIDSCFWHGCPQHFRLPKSNIDYWSEKIRRNKERDTEVTRYYKSIGWNIYRIWEHEIRSNPEEVLKNTIMFINNAKNYN